MLPRGLFGPSSTAVNSWSLGTMRELAQALLALQDLEIVHQESTIVHGQDAPAKTAELDPEIQRLRALIPPVTLKRYTNCRRQNGVAVVREVEGVCLGCHLNIAHGDLNRMLRLEMEWLCPNCGRFLVLSH